MMSIETRNLATEVCTEERQWEAQGRKKPSVIQWDRPATNPPSQPQKESILLTPEFGPPASRTETKCISTLWATCLVLLCYSCSSKWVQPPLPSFCRIIQIFWIFNFLYKLKNWELKLTSENKTLLVIM